MNSPFRIQHYFGSSIPSRGDILCQKTRMIMVRVSYPSESKIADFQVTGGVQKQIARLEISVENIRRVDVFETSKNLI